MSPKDREDKLITHLFLSIHSKVYWSAKEDCFLLKEFIKFTLLLVFGLIKDSQCCNRSFQVYDYQKHLWTKEQMLF